MKLLVTQAAYRQGANDALWGGRPYLDMIINGRQVSLTLEDFKPWLVDKGYIPLRDFREALPEISLPADPAVGHRAMTLKGFTDDPVIVQLVRDFIATWKSQTFKPGPISI